MNKMEDLIEWLKGVAKEHNITVLLKANGQVTGTTIAN